MNKAKKMVDKGIAYLKKNGVRAAAKRLGRKIILSRDVDYEKWLKNHRKQRINRLSGTAAVPIHVVVCGTFTGHVEARDYYLFIEEGDILEADAKETYADAVLVHPEAELFYCDSDSFTCSPEDLKYSKNKAAYAGRNLKCADNVGKKLDGRESNAQVNNKNPGIVRPNCKPDFDPFYLYSTNYIGSGFLVSGRLVQELGMPQDLYAYLLACAGKAAGIVHVPEILCHEGMREDAETRWKKEKEVLKNYFSRNGISAEVTEGPQPWTRKVTYALPQTRPLVSILIPNKDHQEDLEKCIRSIRQFGGYGPYEILILENNSSTPEIHSYYKKLQKEPDIRVLSCEGAFNYARVNNQGAAQAKGDYLLFLNNDTEMAKPDCILELMKYALLPEVGAVGAQLFYGDDTIQHAGVVLGYGGLAGHAFEGLARQKTTEHNEIICPRCCSAVTAACMMVRRSVFEQAGGFDEAFGVAYNDIDLCLRIRKLGKQIIYTPYAQLYHYESQTRGLELTDEKAERIRRESALFHNRWGGLLSQGDPFYNPNLTLEKADYSLKI